jgi:hypothetical protein
VGAIVAGQNCEWRTHKLYVLPGKVFLVVTLFENEAFEQEIPTKKMHLVDLNGRADLIDVAPTRYPGLLE